MCLLLFVLRHLHVTVFAVLVREPHSTLLQ